MKDLASMEPGVECQSDAGLDLVPAASQVVPS